MEFTAEDAKVLIRAVWAVVWSPTAHRLYTLVIGTGVVAICLRSAIKADRWAAGNISKAEAEFERKFLGPIPKSIKSFEEQQQRIRDRARPLRRDALTSLGVSFLTGVMIPTMMLFWVTWQYHWFDPVRSHLLSPVGVPISDPTWLEAVLFTTDQTFRGGLFDLLEIFSWRVAALDNNSANWMFSVGVFGQHLFVEAFIFSGILLYGRSRWQIANYLRRGLASHRQRFEEKQAQLQALAARLPPDPGPTALVEAHHPSGADG